MKKFLLVILFCPLINHYAQWDISASMGLDFKFAPSYRDYINLSFAPVGGKLSSFTSSVNFSSELNYISSPSFQYGVEYSILIDSYNTRIGPAGIYEISYILHRPSLVAYYVKSGIGYKFKFGGGIGWRFVSLSEKIIVQESYSTSGIGFLLKAEGNTILSNNLYALIGFDLRYDIPGEPENTGIKITNSSTKQAVNLNAISIGIKLGITYSF